jgi:hypothetical protein
MDGGVRVGFINLEGSVYERRTEGWMLLFGAVSGVDGFAIVV